MSLPADHPFIPAGAGDSRSPCPALNSLANHGYLPHNGKNIGLQDFVRACREGFNLSYFMCYNLALTNFIRAGYWPWTRIDLVDLMKVEHNASLGRADAAEGNALIVDKALVDQLIADSSDGRNMTIQDFAKARLRRETGLTTPLTFLEKTIAQGESGLTIATFGDKDGKARNDWIKTWFGEERLPEGWTKPSSLGFFDVLPNNMKLAKEMQKLQAERKVV